MIYAREDTIKFDMRKPMENLLYISVFVSFNLNNRFSMLVHESTNKNKNKTKTERNKLTTENDYKWPLSTHVFYVKLLNMSKCEFILF